MKHKRGFTLIEMLVALFVFSILSAILVGALHRVIRAHDGAEVRAANLRQLQLGLLLLSRDIQQVVNRPVVSASGRPERAFIGKPNEMVFTHTGYTALQRVGYEVNHQTLSRLTWQAVDSAPNASPHARPLVANVTQGAFYYLDKHHQFHQDWPVKGAEDQALPRAIKIVLTMAGWGRVERIFPIPYEVQDASNKPKPS